MLAAAILLVAAMLRLAWLGTIPAGLSHDEAVKGYDAWSVLHTGRDQYGERFPLVFRGLGDYREGMLPYLIAASEAVFGLTDLAVRLPTALAGITLVGVTMLIGRELFGARAGLLAGLFLACSPWHVQVSRLAFRAGLLPLVTTLAVWCFLVALRRPRLMLPAGLTLGLALYTYLAGRLFLPLLMMGLLVIYRRELFCRADDLRRRRSAAPWSRPAVPLLLGLVLAALPLAVWGVLHPSEFIGHAAESAGTGAPLRQASDATRRYLTYLGPDHLLTQGDPYPVPSTGRFGALYWPLVPFVLAGIVRMIRRRSSGDLLLLWWLAVYPIPAALTRGVHPDWLRAPCGIGALELTAAAGVTAVYAWLTRRLAAEAERPRRSRMVVNSVLVIGASLYVLNVGWFLFDYTLRFPDRAAPAFNDGVAEAVQRLAILEPDFERVILPSSVPAVHDLYLYHTRYDPARLQRERLEDVAGPGAWADVRGFGTRRVCVPTECCRGGDICLAQGVWSGAGEVLAVVRDRAGRPAFSIVAGE